MVLVFVGLLHSSFATSLLYVCSSFYFCFSLALLFLYFCFTSTLLYFGFALFLTIELVEFCVAILLFWYRALGWKGMRDGRMEGEVRA